MAVMLELWLVSAGTHFSADAFLPLYTPIFFASSASCRSLSVVGVGVGAGFGFGMLVVSVWMFHARAHLRT